MRVWPRQTGRLEPGHRGPARRLTGRILNSLVRNVLAWNSLELLLRRTPAKATAFPELSARLRGRWMKHCHRYDGSQESETFPSISV
jgi:hypothetical protein